MNTGYLTNIVEDFFFYLSINVPRIYIVIFVQRVREIYYLLFAGGAVFKLPIL